MLHETLDPYITEIYRRQATFLLQTISVYLHSVLHSELQKRHIRRIGVLQNTGVISPPPPYRALLWMWNQRLWRLCASDIEIIERRSISMQFSQSDNWGSLGFQNRISYEDLRDQSELGPSVPPEALTKLPRLHATLWSFRVSQSQRNWYQSKAHMRLPISLPRNYSVSQKNRTATINMTTSPINNAY